jgi:hypothetical protein
MSINSMTNAALARRPDYPPLDRQPQTAAERAEAASQEPTQENIVSTALKTLTTYVPTETLTLYIALVAALQPITNNSTPSFTSRWIAFGLFLVFTPLAVWITFATKIASDQKQLPLHPRYWPKWEMGAGTLAFIAWAVGLPDTPFAEFTWYSASIAGFVVLITSTLLGMVAGLFQRPLAPTNPAPNREDPIAG